MLLSASALTLVITFGAAVVLLRKYLASKDTGLLALGLLLFGWGPFVALVSLLGEPLFVQFTASMSAGDVHLWSENLRALSRALAVLAVALVLHGARGKQEPST